MQQVDVGGSPNFARRRRVGLLEQPRTSTSSGEWGSRSSPELCLRAASGVLGGSPNFDLIRVRFAHPPSPAQGTQAAASIAMSPVAAPSPARGTQAFLRKARWLDICRMHPLRPQRKLRVWNEPSPMQGTQSCLRHDRWDVLTIHRPKKAVRGIVKTSDEVELSLCAGGNGHRRSRKEK